jgi:heterogeneous nuclear ribonucleoprotein A1/A3
LFLGGLDYKTDEEILRAYFGQWGTIENAVIVKDPVTRRSRGFGFVTYTRSEMVEMVQSNGPHEIDGKTIEPKLAVKKKQEEKETTIKKLFVGGFKEDCEESDLREYFSQFGVVNATNIVMDKQTGKKKGYGFVEFTETVDAGVCKL